MTDPIISIQDLVFAWPGGAPVLDIPAFQMQRGESLFLRGPSGSGKSTLLGLIAGVLVADRGHVSVVGQNLTDAPGRVRDRIRADHLGVVFQMFNLVPYLSVEQNVTLPCRFSPRRAAHVRSAGGAGPEAQRLLQRLGLSDPDLIGRPVTALSVGQQQRVAVARALIGGPDLIIADEPTSALDHAARQRFIDLLTEEVASSGAALLFVSHDSTLSTHFDHTINLPEINRAAVLEPAQ